MNYEDPNYNVSIPVFTIHGNHDDPAGVSRSMYAWGMAGMGGRVGGRVGHVYMCVCSMPLSI